MPGLSGTAKDGWSADRGSSSCTWVRSGGEEVPALDTAGGEGKPVAVIVRSLGIGYLTLQLGLFTVTCLHYLGAPYAAVPITAATALLMVGLPAADTVRARNLPRYLFWLMVGAALATDAGLVVALTVVPHLEDLVPVIFYPPVWAVIGWVTAILLFLPSTWHAGRKAAAVLLVLLACILPLLWASWVYLMVPSGMYEGWGLAQVFGAPLVLVSAITNFAVSRLYHRQASRSAPDRPGPCPG